MIVNKNGVAIFEEGQHPRELRKRGAVASEIISNKVEIDPKEEPKNDENVVVEKKARKKAKKSEESQNIKN